MELYLDVNMSATEVSALQVAGYDVIWAYEDASLRTQSDSFHAQNAEQQGRIIITKDSDFGTLKAMQSIPATGMVFIKEDANTKGLAKSLPGIVKAHAAALSRGAQITVGANRIRVREQKPPTQERQQTRPGRSRSRSAENNPRGRKR